MDSGYGQPPYSPMPSPSEDTNLWEDPSIQHPVSNNTQLISDGYEFTEVPWYLQCDFNHIGSTSPDPTPSVDVSTQLDVVAEQVDPLGGPIVAQEPQEASPSLFSVYQPFLHTFYGPSGPQHYQSLTPYTAQAASPLPSISSDTHTQMSTPSLSDEEARWILNSWIMNSDWHRQDKLEPMVGDPGVPACALQLASSGQSIYCSFLIPIRTGKGKNSKITGWKSATDPTGMPDRHPRAIGKERTNRDHCPFKCPRNHDPHCDFKGCSKESLSDHLARRNNPIECPQCSKPIATKNMPRHIQAVHRR